ncbi:MULTISPECIES: type II secretion system protein GspM [unclassified Pseudomonas]|uniref:type II secretion system protein GspM n=1 Tax=unclassified Pseudomonas TaxID=196821 RepID=UPI000C2FC01C|nr:MULTISPECIES: type II secretion system protein GspM [unclassified Pseudomonas]MCU1742166.1 type II secretion system protein M [Pseudomonas sp. 20S_6.2_Bac1]
MNKALINRYRNRWRQFSSQVRLYWQNLAQRERQLVLGMALGVSGLLVWFVLIQPPLRKIDFWSLETPKLRTQAQTLDGLLQGLAGPSAGNIEVGLRSSLDAGGLAGHYQLQNVGTGWLLTFDDAPADGLVGWLLGNPPLFTLEVVEARLQRKGATEPDGTAGKLSGTVRMDQALGAKEAS